MKIGYCRFKPNSIIKPKMIKPKQGSNQIPEREISKKKNYNQNKSSSGYIMTNVSTEVCNTFQM